MARYLAAFVVLLLCLGTSAWVLHRPVRKGAPMHGMSCAGSTPQPQADMVPADTIDGAVHPELIPDTIAYRLVLVSIAEPADATPEQKARQRAFLRAAGLKEGDVGPAANLLAAFKSQYDGFITRYNEAIQTANESGSDPDPAALAALSSERDNLVASTREALKQAVSSGAIERFDKYVQREKRNMKVAREAQ